jgi:hypothetical protein
MDLDPQVLSWLAAGVVLAVSLIVVGISQLDRTQIKKYLQKHTPDEVEFLLNMVWDAAWKAVDAQIEQFGKMSNAEKQAQAMKYVKLLLKFLATGKLESEANAAYLEYRLLENKQFRRYLKKPAA